MTHTMDEAGGDQGLADQTSAKVQDAASAAQDKASELRDQGTVRLRDQFDQRSNQAGSQIRSLAEALRHSGNELSNQGNANASQLTGQAADQFERLGTYLEQKSGDQLMRDMETFARRRPWMLAGLGMLAGVAAARFVKASSEQRYGDSQRMGQQAPTRRGLTDGGAGSFPGGNGGGGYVSEPVGATGGSALSDDRFAPDPYAGRR